MARNSAFSSSHTPEAWKKVSTRNSAAYTGLRAVVFQDVRLDDRVDRAALLAEAAEDALGQVDVVARRAAGAVGALVALDRDRQRGAHGLAQLAGDAAFLAVLVAAQRVQAAEARRQRRLLLGELHGDLAGEEVLARD